MQGYYQFITFRTHESINSYVQKIQNSNDTEKIKQYKIDTYLDSSKTGAYLNNEAIDILLEVILFEDENLYDVEILCIMPNHVHILLKQNADLNEIMKYIKGKSAVELNRYLGKTGKFWAAGYFDKAIRNDKHFSVVYNYIKNNPLKAGLEDGRVFGKYE